MSWWTTVSGLTPIAAWDADHVSSSTLLDVVGSNNATTSVALTLNEGAYRYLNGNNNTAFTMGSAVSIPSTGVFLLFLRSAQAYVGMSYASGSTNYMLTHWSNNDWYFNKNNTYNNIGVSDTSFSTDEVVALITGATTTQLYRNGVAIGSAVPNSWVPTLIDRLGQSSYWLTSADRFMAAGFWSGTATQSDLVALEAALRTALEVVVTVTYKALISSLGRLITAPAEAMTSTGVVPVYRGQPLGLLNPYFGGAGRIVGTVKVTPNSAVHRKVRLFHEASGILLAQVWSTEGTGAYEFQNLKMGERYTVLAYDHTEQYLAVVADRVLPEMMP